MGETPPGNEGLQHSGRLEGWNGGPRSAIVPDGLDDHRNESATDMILVTTSSTLYGFDPEDAVARRLDGLNAGRPTCLAAAREPGGPLWCGTSDAGVLRSDDGGASWSRTGLEDERVTAIAVSPSDPDVVWVGTEPSGIRRTPDGGATWERRPGLRDLPSEPEWSFPPRPDTDHVRWIACHPTDPGRLWVAIEAGALVATSDGGERWQDRVPGGPYDTHELAVDPRDPDRLHSAAGDGYYESDDGGRTWTSPSRGLEVGYFRSVALDPTNPGVVLVSGSTGPHTAYRAGRSDGRIYRREGADVWSRVTDGRPDSPSTIAPLLASEPARGAVVAVDERGLHRSTDGGLTWTAAGHFPEPIDSLWALVVVP